MSSDKAIAAFALRAAEIREIAKGIFDKAERQKLLRFVADCEKMAHANTFAKSRPVRKG